MVVSEPLEPLFDASLISSEVVNSLPESYTIRPLDRGDHARGFFDCLRVLSNVGDVTEAQFQERFDWMKSQGRGVHYHIVIEHENCIVGTGAVIVEKKLCVTTSRLILCPWQRGEKQTLIPITSIHDLGTVGHVEEIAVRDDYQGKRIGIKVLAGLTSIAKAVGCYKSTLGCSVKNEPFYVKCGYQRNEGRSMSQYYEEVKSPYMRG